MQLTVKHDQWLAEREAELAAIRLEVAEGKYDLNDSQKVDVVVQRLLAELAGRPDPVITRELRIQPTKASRCYGTISGDGYVVGLFHSGEAIVWIRDDETNIWAELYRMQGARANDAERLAHAARLVVGLTPEERGRQTRVHGDRCGVAAQGTLYRLRDTVWVVTHDGKGYFHGMV